MVMILIGGRFRTDYIFLSAMLALLIPGIITPMDAIAGFTNPAVITVGALFVVAAGVQNVNLLSSVETLIMPRKVGTGRLLFRLMGVTSVLSAFLNNTPIVAMLTPQLQQWAKKNGISVSKLLIPLSYAAIAGGTITLIGTSTNLIVSGMLSERGQASFHLFQFAWIGIPASVLVLAWFALIGHRFLPDRQPAVSVPASDVTRIIADSLKGRSNNPSGVYSSYKSGENRLRTSRPNWPSGVYIMSGFRWVSSALEAEDSSMRSHAETAISPLRTSGALVILVLMVGLSAFGILPVHMSVILAAVAMVVSGILPFRRIGEYVQFPVLIVIAAAIGIGSALESTGVAEVLATNVIEKTSGLGVIAVLIGIYLMTNLLTELITNNAAAVLMIPIAMNTSLSLGIDPTVTGIIVAVAASASFLSPIGYQTNLMVMNPGGYRFTDYMKAGFPVTLILMTVTIVIANWLWL